MDKYLESSAYIDWTHPLVRNVAISLSKSNSSTEDVARRCFEFVRDEIRHSTDANDEILTAKASEVLEAGTGFCFAKSHLLAALLRANSIPAALCYQKLRGENGYTLHGLNAVHLDEFGWYRIDPRGNKPGINAQFSPPMERLAFKLQESEEDIVGYWSEPLPSVLRVLTTFDNVNLAKEHLPSTVE